MARILITGGAGFIGSHLVKALLKQRPQDRIAIIDDLSTGSYANIRELHEGGKIDFYAEEMIASDKLPFLIDEADLIYHLAAAVGVELVVNDPCYTIHCNLDCTQRLLDLARKKGKRVFIASTSEVYGRSDRDIFSEDDDLLIGPPTLGRWSYACSKLMDEFLALSYFRQYQLPVTVVRFFNTVGAGQTGRYGMVLPRFVQQALANEPLAVYGDGAQRRCFGSVNDCVRSLIALASTDQSIGEVVNIGSQEEISILELAKTVRATAGSKSEILFKPYLEVFGEKFEDMRHRKPNVDKLRRLTGITFEEKLPTIIQTVIAHEKKQPTK